MKDERPDDDFTTNLSQRSGPRLVTKGRRQEYLEQKPRTKAMLSLHSITKVNRFGEKSGWRVATTSVRSRGRECWEIGVVTVTLSVHLSGIQ